MGFEDPGGTPPTDFYGDPEIQPPPTAYDKLWGFVGFMLTLAALLVLAAVLGAIAGSEDVGEPASKPRE